MKKPIQMNSTLLLSGCVALLIFFSIHSDGQIANNKCKFLGNIISNNIPSSFNTYWNQVTPENSGKWGSVEGTRNVMNWGALDLAYNHAKTNGFPFKQHTFVWGQQQPAWITQLMNNTAIPQEERYAEVRAEVEQWIRLYCERYPDTDFIDVVNEPFHATPSYDLALGTGWNWVVWAFQKAREYCPNAKLHLNEYNILNSDGATNNYLALINILKGHNLIDGIGIQCHRFEIENAPVTQLKSNLDKLATSGLPIFISEFDIGNLNNTSTGNPTTDDNVQLEIYQRVFPVLWTHPAVEGITLWGYLQGQTWQATAYLLRNDGTERPALTWLKSYVPTVPGGSFCLTTSLDEEIDNLSVFPNPSSTGKFIVESSSRFELSITLRDMQGKIVTQQTVATNNATTIDISDTPGLYLLEVFDGKKTVYKKLIVQP
ncbi:MAG TPA: endo-1,4-beta-xylanase [Cyclobacteriaceae bacterium]|nr:endo-1,4-beta-xylanase [Cyclobacteriaceae bacterium]HRJ83204.1 endo-1,4-beta-xylanase [Cyclobacteriaceae bacterium]